MTSVYVSIIKRIRPLPHQKYEVPVLQAPNG